MKQIIPFKKEIVFKTMICKITSISLEHTLSLQNDDIISGDFIVSGTYKMTEASQIDEEFSYKIPIEIAIDSKYNTDNLTLDIDDFVYEILDEERLLLKIDLCIDKLELKEEKEEEQELISTYDEYEELNNSLNELEEELNEAQLTRDEDNSLFLETSQPQDLEVPINIDSISSINKKPTPEIMPYYNEPIVENNVKDMNEENNNVTSIFSAFKDTDETFSTYSIYIIREGDTIESVLNKYKTTRDELSLYNDLQDVRIGSKIIIPSANE